MADFVHKQDRFYAPFAITSSDNTLTIIDPDDGTLTCNPATRNDYYNHLDTSENGTHGYSFLGVVEAAINIEATTGTYTITSSTPSGSDLDLSGISITRSPATDFSIDFDATTLDPRLIGWGADKSGTESSTSGVLASPYSLRAVWQSYTIADNAASRKDTRPLKNIALSSEDVAVAARKKYLEKTFRTLRYDYVPGAHVRKNRGGDLASSNTAGLPQGDVNNSFHQFWDLATEGDTDDRLAKIVIAHDIGADGYETVFDGTHDEIARLSDPEQIKRPDEIWSMLRMAGEYYRLEFTVDVVSGNYDQ